MSFPQSVVVHTNCLCVFVRLLGLSKHFPSSSSKVGTKSNNRTLHPIALHPVRIHYPIARRNRRRLTRIQLVPLCSTPSTVNDYYRTGEPRLTMSPTTHRRTRPMMSVLRLKDLINDIRHLTEGPDQRSPTPSLQPKYTTDRYQINI